MLEGKARRQVKEKTEGKKKGKYLEEERKWEELRTGVLMNFSCVSCV